METTSSDEIPSDAKRRAKQRTTDWITDQSLTNEERLAIVHEPKEFSDEELAAEEDTDRANEVEKSQMIHLLRQKGGDNSVKKVSICISDETSRDVMFAFHNQRKVVCERIRYPRQIFAQNFGNGRVALKIRHELGFVRWMEAGSVIHPTDGEEKITEFIFKTICS